MLSQRVPTPLCNHSNAEDWIPGHLKSQAAQVSGFLMCCAPTRWSKYTTLMVVLDFHLLTRVFLSRKLLTHKRALARQVH